MTYIKLEDAVKALEELYDDGTSIDGSINCDDAIKALRSLPTDDGWEDIAKDRADWLLDAIATATQDRRFLRGEPEYDEDVGEVILLNAEKAIRIAIQRALGPLPAPPAC